MTLRAPDLTPTAIGGPVAEAMQAGAMGPHPIVGLRPVSHRQVFSGDAGKARLNLTRSQQLLGYHRYNSSGLDDASGPVENFLEDAEGLHASQDTRAAASRQLAPFAGWPYPRVPVSSAPLRGRSSETGCVAVEGVGYESCPHPWPEGVSCVVSRLAPGLTDDGLNSPPDLEMNGVPVAIHDKSPDRCPRALEALFCRREWTLGRGGAPACCRAPDLDGPTTVYEPIERPLCFEFTTKAT